VTHPRAAFVDIAFRRRTRSSDFFTALLRETHQVDVHYLNADPTNQMAEIAASGYDLIVCWQTEFCAPYFLACDLRVVCVPMFDAVERAPAWYWALMKQARFVNFSRALHLLHKEAGVESQLVQYCDPAAVEGATPA
jgi:hypothetical protein